MAKSVVKTTPIEAFWSNLPKLCIHCVNTAVNTPMTAAPRNMGTLSRLWVIRKAMAKPGRMAWLIASPIMLIRRSTR